MAAREQPSAPAKPSHGRHCPVCNNGILYAIAETDNGVYLACFNCDTRGTIPHDDDAWQGVLSDDVTGASPAGFQLTASQLAAKREAGVDPYRERAGSTATAGAPATASEQPADQQPGAGEADQQPGAGGEHAG